MANVLSEWTLKDKKADSLLIARGKSPFSSGYLDDPERLKKLVDYCSSYFKRDIRIIIEGKGVKNGNSKDIDSKSPDLPEAVREVLQVFGSDIKGEVDVNRKNRTDIGNNSG